MPPLRPRPRPRVVAVAACLALAAACRPGPAAQPTASTTPTARAVDSPATTPAVRAPLAQPAPPDAQPEGDPPLPFEEVVTGGAAPDARLPLVVAIHGLGDTPGSFVRLFASLPVPARVIAPRGLDPFEGGGGYSWFPSRSARRDLGWLTEGITRATTRLRASIAAYARARPTCGRPVVTGFSQGGILSFALAVERPDALAAAVPIAGALVPALRPRPAARGEARPPVRAAHGAADARISAADARATVASLRAAGYDATLREFPGVGHTVDAAMAAYVASELSRAVRAACPEQPAVARAALAP